MESLSRQLLWGLHSACLLGLVPRGAPLPTLPTVGALGHVLGSPFMCGLHHLASTHRPSLASVSPSYG